MFRCFFLFSFFFSLTQSVDYSFEGKTLTISGTGIITKSGVRSKNTYDSFLNVFILEGPSKIEKDSFYECRALKHITIPTSITSIEPCFSRCRSLYTIEVDPDNQFYKTDNQCILYTHDGKTLIRAPTRPNLTFCDELEIIEDCAFGSERFFNFGTVVFPQNTKTLKDFSLYSAFFDSISFSHTTNLTMLNGLAWSYVKVFTVPSSVTSIKSKTFDSVTVEKILFEEGSHLQTVGDGSFRNLNTTKIDLPDSVLTIEANAFLNANISVININEICSSISDSAFNGCPLFLVININKNNTNYMKVDGVVLDRGCTQIINIEEWKTSLTIPSSVTKIGKASLQKLPHLTTIVLEGNPVWSTEAGVLYSKDFTKLIAVCGGVTSVNVHSNVKTIEGYAAFQCSALTSLTFKGDLVTSIGENAFSNTNIKSFGLPNSVKTIGKYAFKETTNLTSFTVKIDSCLTTIMFEAFAKSSIQSFYFPKGVEEIGIAAFTECQFKTITFAVNSIVNLIDLRAFSSSMIESIVFPSSLIELKDGAFGYCSKLVTVTFAENSILESIGPNTFCFCHSLKKVVLPPSCQKIGGKSFENNELLTEFTHSLTTIENMAFSGCSGLTNFNFSATQEVIPNSVFNNCNNLKYFTVDAHNPHMKDLDGCVYDKEELILILFPPGQENAMIRASTISFADNAFYSNLNLKSVAFYSGSMLNTISGSAFAECKNLNVIQLPPALKTIRSKAFFGCASLERIIFPDSITTIETGAFLGCKLLMIKYCGTNTISGVNVFDSNLKVCVTDLYSSDSFCSLKVSRMLLNNCELKPQFEKRQCFGNPNYQHKIIYGMFKYLII